MTRVEAIIIAIIVAISLWDVWLAVSPPRGDTISEIKRKWSASHPFVPFAWGALGGHFFGPELALVPPWSPLLLAGLGALLLGLGFLGRVKAWGRLGWTPRMMLLFAGVLAGALLWSQKEVETWESREMSRMRSRTCDARASSSA